MATPSDLICSFFIRPVIWIIDPSWALISAIIFFGPFMRTCMPCGMSKLLPASFAARGPTVKIYPLVHPGTDTRAESFGTGLFS
jgi:hypothetical protein